jgi:hypothetical protein
MATPTGPNTHAAGPGPSSPQVSRFPLPATVTSTRLTASTTRTRDAPVSAMNTSPVVGCTATPFGRHNDAAAASDPSGAKADVPLPATVVMVPLDANTRRIRSLPRSAIKTSPVRGSTATLVGESRQHADELASPPSPAKHAVPLPESHTHELR